METTKEVNLVSSTHLPARIGVEANFLRGHKWGIVMISNKPRK